MCQIFGELRWNDSKPVEASSRYAARKQIDRLEAMNMDLLSGIEWEYVLTNQETGKALFSGNDYAAALVIAEYDSWFIDVHQAMMAAGVEINTMHSEYGPGQFEFSTVPKMGLRGIDNSTIMKQGIREMAMKRGWLASFMAKNQFTGSGSGAHFSFSIWDRNTKANCFYDANNADGLSKLARYWIGGIIKHAAAICAFCCSTTNCYQRLHGPWTPHLANWGFEDRNAMLRVKNDGSQNTYMENRLPSALANPYLVTAATLAAGIDGILNKIPCPEASEVEEAVPLPRSLGESLDALLADEALVSAIGKELVDWYVQLKMDVDIKAVPDTLSDSERIQKETGVYLRLC